MGPANLHTMLSSQPNESKQQRLFSLSGGSLGPGLLVFQPATAAIHRENSHASATLLVLPNLVMTLLESHVNE